MHNGLISYHRAIASGYLAVGGLFFGRHSSSPEYSLDGWRRKALPVAIFVVAEDLSAVIYMSVPACSWQKNLELFLSACACFTATPIVMHLFLTFYSRLKLYTEYQYQERRSLSAELPALNTFTDW